MKPSRKFLSLPIFSLQEGQHIGYVKNLILDAQNKSLAALVVDPKGFFKDQRIIPYNKVISVGDDAITIDKGSHVEKSSNLPELLDLIKDKLGIIGTKVVTESGKTLGMADEYLIDPETGKITRIQISGGKLEGLLNGKAWVDSEQIITIGHDVIVAKKGTEGTLYLSDKGLSDTLKSLLHSTTHLAVETTHTITSYFKKEKAVSVEDIALADTSLDGREQKPAEGQNSKQAQGDGTTSTEETYSKALGLPSNSMSSNSMFSNPEDKPPITKEPLG